MENATASCVRGVTVVIDAWMSRDTEPRTLRLDGRLEITKLPPRGRERTESAIQASPKIIAAYGLDVGAAQAVTPLNIVLALANGDS